jgi:hypothetical protein
MSTLKRQLAKASHILAVRCAALSGRSDVAEFAALAEKGRSHHRWLNPQLRRLPPFRLLSG